MAALSSFALCPSDMVQGQDLANYAKTMLARSAHPTIVVFRDPNDAYSNGLATIFSTDMAAARPWCRRTIPSRVDPLRYLAPGIQDDAAQASRKPGLILFAGYASDALRMGQALDALGDRTTPVLSDDAFYDPAEFIAYGKVFKGRYHFTGYFYPDQGSLLPRTSAGAQ